MQTPDTTDLALEIRRTNPDYIVYAPKDRTGKNGATGNEHFLVFDGPDGSLMAVWTQSTREADPDQHIAFSQSLDEGRTWKPPVTIAGPPITEPGLIASWAFPLVSRSGRIYIIYSQGLGKELTPHATSGAMHGIYSDDAGKTWSTPKNIPMPRSIYDSPDTRKPGRWVVWQRPDRLTRDGRYFVGMTRWVDPAVRTPKPITSWIADESVVEFLRFENIDDNPAVDGIRITWLCQNQHALRVPFPGTPKLSVAQEPSLVKLPDGGIFCCMRSSSGHPWWSVSHDDGDTWTAPRIIRESDNGPELKHPLSPCPIYDLGGAESGSGNYLFFIHNHDGHFGPWGPTDTGRNRRPVYRLRGTFKPGASQPVWFAFESKDPFMDQGEVGLGPIDRPRYDFALYASFTVRNGQPVLWYPERKTFLLGRRM